MCTDALDQPTSALFNSKFFNKINTYLIIDYLDSKDLSPKL
jgi:hypothetical protein